jgi:hypothetical protein
MILNYFREQIEGGATDNWFYGTEMNGEVRVERHRGSLDAFPTNLKFIRMAGSVPFFTLDTYDEQGGEQGWAER